MFGFLKKILNSGKPPQRKLQEDGGFEVDELARRLRVSEQELRDVPVQYNRFELPKRGGGMRTILSPAPQLKAMQRRILRLLLARLKVHPCATGFERGHSIVTNALPHVGQDVVIRLDIQNFFTSTKADRVKAYFREIGWGTNACEILTNLCTYEKGLPQGAPTSPRLSNLLNFNLDARLAGLAEKRGLSYSRYADDITLSGSIGTEGSKQQRINDVIHLVKFIVEEEGYDLHEEKKLRIHRRHDRQLVTGLVVNQRVNLPRATRRRLRATEHRLKKTGKCTLTPRQLAGWNALKQMIATQSSSG